MHISRMTALWIQSDQELEILAYKGEKQQYAFYIGSYDETPSGCRRIRPLLTSQYIYKSETEAIEAANSLVKTIREQGETINE